MTDGVITKNDPSINTLLEIQERLLAATEKKIAIEQQRKELEKQRLELEAINRKTAEDTKNLLSSLNNELMFLRQNVHPIIANIQYWMPLNLECNRTVIAFLTTHFKINSKELNELNERIQKVSESTLTSIHNLTVNTTNIDKMSSNNDINMKIEGD